MAPYYPVYLDVKDRLCVIIGGGPIGEGKIASLLECGANIRMICPDVTEDVQDMADTGVIHLEKRVYEEGDLEGAFVVIAATNDNTVNRRIADEAESLGVLLNVADVTHLCNFIAPSVVRKGEVTVAISTAGLSPALARKLRETLEVSGDLDYADMASTLAEVRGELRGEGNVINADHWQACLTQELLDLFYRDRDAAKATLKEALLQDPHLAKVTAV
jgi:precorrin-2 dehydrogenase/sirohydrochlorin ferrochelatase